jgi:tRNA threonylcarbamoyladenosine biosynthesis protein TsaB
MATPPAGERFLILETSGKAGQVALAQAEVLLGSRLLDEARRHARDLAPAVAVLLRELDWSPRDINGVIVSLGPGSYTGLRVGIMSAKAFAYATGAALIAVDTLHAVALQAPFDASPLDVIADAQQDRIYVQRFERAEGGSGVVAASALAIRQFDEWLKECSSSIWTSGPGLRRFRSRLPANCPVVDAIWWDPLPDSLLAIGRDRYQRGERDDPVVLEPIYLRPSSAEEKLHG